MHILNVLCCNCPFFLVTMVEQFVGKWKMTSSDNFDEYMKAVGAGFASRQMANLAKPSLTIALDDQGFISMKAVTTLKTLEIKFKLDEEFDETTADDRKVKTILSLADGKLIQTQTWEGKTTIIEREIQDCKMIAKCTMDDVVAIRTYEKDA
ncbi:fatty acid-binding protein, adipocyte-like [Megalobrama amblycephala]|uniref:fatty acid-binding protein, adipocyte-like n=1 Tax=Megalobrama amblycephala TaxID=75352 RepID=UPI0020147BF7|nr:fatty acid-binding protein, adipocyte-like [Megalobrama amblycephala]